MRAIGLSLSGQGIPRLTLSLTLGGEEVPMSPGVCLKFDSMQRKRERERERDSFYLIYSIFLFLFFCLSYILPLSLSLSLSLSLCLFLPPYIAVGAHPSIWYVCDDDRARGSTKGGMNTIGSIIHRVEEKRISLGRSFSPSITTLSATRSPRGLRSSPTLDAK